MFLQNKQPCTKPVSSELFFAANPRPKPRKRRNLEGTWSLLSRAEAQDHLYVTPSLCFLFPRPVTCNREEKIHFSSKNSNKNRYSPRQLRQKFVRNWELY